MLDAVVYARDLERLDSFYRALLGLELAECQVGYWLLAAPTFELTVVAIPPALADTFELTSPLERREATPIELAFRIASLAAARGAVPTLGGELTPPERQWSFRGWCICDGIDPGRQRLPAARGRGGRRSQRVTAAADGGRSPAAVVMRCRGRRAMTVDRPTPAPLR